MILFLCNYVIGFEETDSELRGEYLRCLIGGRCVARESEVDNALAHPQPLPYGCLVKRPSRLESYLVDEPFPSQ